MMRPVEPDSETPVNRDPVSRIFGLNHSQPELDFVDVPAGADIPLFVDPFALSQRPDAWSRDAHATLLAFFQRVVDSVRKGAESEALALLQYFKEPNETRLGLSRSRSAGAGVGGYQAGQLFGVLRASSAVKTGFLKSLQDCELVVEGIGRDKISDLTTNIIRGHLADYTRDQCHLHGIPLKSLPLPPFYSIAKEAWVSDYFELPDADGTPLLLVPKVIARFDPAYDHRAYYREFVLTYLQADALSTGTSLVRTLKSGKRVAYKKDMEAAFPLSKEFLFRFSKGHPEVLAEYRATLEKLEREGGAFAVAPDDERALAQALALVLEKITPGPADAAEYHRLMVGVVEFLFFPSLLCPRKEAEIHEGRKRIDIVAENGAFVGLFHRLHSVRGYPCNFVPMECKNYQTDVANPELDQLSSRFSPLRGKAGLLFCRHFENRSLFVQRCRDTLKDDRGLILPFDDNVVRECLDLIASGRRGEIERVISRIADEIWLS
jgi:hypothetical protein